MFSVENIGGIFMANNITTTCHNKHIDIMYKYVNQYVVNGMVKRVLASSAENDSNILTENISEEMHWRHSRKMIDEKPY